MSALGDHGSSCHGCPAQAPHECHACGVAQVHICRSEGRPLLLGSHQASRREGLPSAGPGVWGPLLRVPRPCSPLSHRAGRSDISLSSSSAGRVEIIALCLFAARVTSSVGYWVTPSALFLIVLFLGHCWVLRDFCTSQTLVLSWMSGFLMFPPSVELVFLPF